MYPVVKDFYCCGDVLDLSGVVEGMGADVGSLDPGVNSAGVPNSGSCNDSGADGSGVERIPLASTIDQRQSSSGPGVIPIFSWNAVVLKGLASALR